jgi:hypothetical protein
MFKVYLDWNVMTQLKHGNHVELSTMLANKELYQIVYSTSHISDILVSYDDTEKQNCYIDEDLTYISKLTGDLCVYNATTEIIIDYQDPKFLFKSRIGSDVFLSDGNYFDKLLADFAPGSEPYITITQLRDSPIPQVISEALIDPEKADYVRSAYPGLEENPTMGNLINISMKKQRALMTTDSYKQLRTSLQESVGLKANTLFDHPDPFAKIQKLHDNVGLTWPASPNTHSPIWFQQMTNSYVALDMHGYQQDKVKVSNGGRNETMRNTLDDGFHAAFATLCDYYITSDGRAYKKTKAIYNKFKIGTKVYTPEEFVMRYSNLDKNENNDISPISSMEQLTELGKVLEKVLSVKGLDNKIKAILHYWRSKEK